MMHNFRFAGRSYKKTGERLPAHLQRYLYNTVSSSNNWYWHLGCSLLLLLRTAVELFSAVSGGRSVP